VSDDDRESSQPLFAPLPPRLLRRDPLGHHAELRLDPLAVDANDQAAHRGGAFVALHAEPEVVPGDDRGRLQRRVGRRQRRQLARSGRAAGLRTRKRADGEDGQYPNHGDAKDPLSDLKPGTTVIIHSTADNTAQEIDRVGADGLVITEGIATKIDRGKKEITIRYDNGKIEKLKLTDRAAADVGKNIGEDTLIVV
jgi:hypothetical protein